MRKVLHLILVFLTISSFCHARYDFMSHVRDTVTPSEQDIVDLYELYLSKVEGISHSPERYETFKANTLDIFAHNNNPASTWTRGINKFTGMTWSELVGGPIMEPQDCSATTRSVVPPPKVAIPSSFDWTTTGVITPVKDQKDCGSCWTFSTTGCLEAYWSLYTNTTPTMLSEQQLVDCAQDFGNQGCSGGLPSNAFEYITEVGGLNTENAYPYEGMDEECSFDEKNIGAIVFGGSVNITEGDENTILNTVGTIGPVSVAFQVTSDFFSYTSGVYVGTTCTASTQTVNHAVLAVGYGTDAASGLDYWKVKNSWGPDWGEAGYFLIERGVNMCGIAECASYPNMTETSRVATF